LSPVPGFLSLSELLQWPGGLPLPPQILILLFWSRCRPISILPCWVSLSFLFTPTVQHICLFLSGHTLHLGPLCVHHPTLAPSVAPQCSKLLEEVHCPLWAKKASVSNDEQLNASPCMIWSRLSPLSGLQLCNLAIDHGLPM
jgi:hypothetical protein